jgi:hypothetical protein
VAAASAALPLSDVGPVPADGGPWAGSEGSTALLTTATCATGNSSFKPGLRLTGFASAGSGTVTAMTLGIRGSSTNLDPASKMRATLHLSDGTSCVLPERSTMPPSGSVGTVRYAFSLSSCPSLVDGSLLDGASLSVTPYVYGKNPKLPYSISIDHAWLEVSTSNAAPPSALSTQVDVAGGKGMWFAGQVQVPASDVNVNWQGTASAAPIFGGGLLAKGLASWHLNAGAQVGVLAAPSIVPASRRVLLRARVGSQLRGSAIVTVDDADSAGTSASPGNRLSIDDWRLCNEPWPTDDSEVPCPAP